MNGKDDWRVAIIVDPALAPGLLANTVAVIAVGLGVAAPGLGGDAVADGRGRAAAGTADRPVPVLQAAAPEVRAVLLRALPPPDGGVVVPFPAFARSIHRFADYQAALPARDLADEAIDGFGLAGPARWVRSLTGALKLL